MTTTPLSPADPRSPASAGTDVPAQATEIRLARRPHGPAVAEDFAIVTVDVPHPAPGQLLVRNLVFSVDPYMRGRMNDGPSYAAPWELDQPMVGGTIGEVVADGSGGVGVGTIVEHGLGWREFALVGADQASVLDPGDQPLSPLPRCPRNDGAHRLGRPGRHRGDATG